MEEETVQNLRGEQNRKNVVVAGSLEKKGDDYALALFSALGAKLRERGVLTPEAAHALAAADLAARS